MDQSLSEQLFNQIHQSANLLHRSFHVARKRTDAPMQRGQWRVLAVLNKQDGAALKDLVELLDIRPSSVGELVTKLEQAELAERRQDEADKRITRVYLTEKGHAQAQSLLEGRDAYLAALLTGLSEEEQKTLSALLEKLIASLKASFAGEMEFHKDRRFMHHTEGQGCHGRHHGPQHGPWRGPQGHPFEERPYFVGPAPEARSALWEEF